MATVYHLADKLVTLNLQRELALWELWWTITQLLNTKSMSSSTKGIRIKYGKSEAEFMTEIGIASYIHLFLWVQWR